MYYVKVTKPTPDWYGVEIEIKMRSDPFAGKIYIRVYRNYESGKLVSEIRPSVGWSASPCTPEDLRDIADWFRLAAQGSETLSALIKSPDDLKRPITARMVSRTLVINFTETEED